jgi:hypothetical protein
MKNLISISALALALALAASCGGNDNKTSPDAPPPADAAIDGPPPCFSGTPTNHDQLINACVDQSVTVIHKSPALPLMLADGTLPTLP